MSDEIKQCVSCHEMTADIHYRNYSVCHPCFFKDPLGYSVRVAGRPVRADVRSVFP